MSTVSVVSNSSVDVDSDSSSEVSPVDGGIEQKFILPNELYKSLLASAVLGKTVLNRNLNLKDNLANLKDNLNALGALKELKDLKGLTVSSVPAFPRNLALHREDHDEVKTKRIPTIPNYTKTKRIHISIFRQFLDIYYLIFFSPLLFLQEIKKKKKKNPQ